MLMVMLYLNAKKKSCDKTDILHQINIGSHFGTTFAHLMFETYAELVPQPKPHIYQPRIFGFRVNESSRSGPKMQWLRMRPENCTEVDEENEENVRKVKK